MQASLDALDRQLVHVLQVHPRVSWTDAAPVLGVSATTLAARWRRIEEARLAWVAVHPNPAVPGFLTATVDLLCRPADRERLGRELSRDRRILSIEQSSRGSDLFLTVMVADLAALSQLVFDELTAAPGVDEVRSAVVIQALSIFNEWGLGALEPDQASRIRELAQADTGGSVPGSQERLPADLWPLIEALNQQGRRSVAELARLTGRNPATVRRHLAALLASRLLTFRCDVVHQEAGWPVTSMHYARVPTAEMARTAEVLRRVGRLRMCLHTTGQTNLVFSVFTRTVAEVAAFEQHLARHLPWVEVEESLIMLRPLKRMGWIIGADGRRSGELVPSQLMDPTWSAPRPARG